MFHPLLDKSFITFWTYSLHRITAGRPATSREARTSAGLRGRAVDRQVGLWVCSSCLDEPIRQLDTRKRGEAAETRFGFGQIVAAVNRIDRVTVAP